MSKGPSIESIVTYTAAILANPDAREGESLGQAECGGTSYEVAIGQLRTAEDHADRYGGAARLYGNDCRGRRICLAEYHPRRGK